MSKLPECLPARPSTLTHLWAQLIATLRPCCFCSQSHMATHQLGIAARKSYLCGAWRHFVYQQLFHQIWHAFRQWIKVFSSGEMTLHTPESVGLPNWMRELVSEADCAQAKLCVAGGWNGQRNPEQVNWSLFWILGNWIKIFISLDVVP